MTLQTPVFSRLAALASFALLTACGGGGGQDTSASADGPAMLPTVYTSEGRVLGSCSLVPACSGNPYAPFFANMTVAPANGATVSGIVRIEVSGNEMENVELLPATGYAPKYGVFNLTGDKTRAWMDLDTTALPNGPLSVRISAFNAPAGQPGIEIAAMPARTWNINNAPRSPAPFAASVATAPANGAILRGTTRLEVRGNALANVELLPATGYAPRLGVFNISADRTYAWLDLDSRSLPDGARDVRISAFSATQGQPGGTEIVAMPARRWTFGNGLSFSASVTMAPPHGALARGMVMLEVRGTGLENVELLREQGYAPLYGRFSIYAKSFAWLVLDTSTLPPGPFRARISAFNKSAGTTGAVEVIAMPVRDWVIAP